MNKVIGGIGKTVGKGWAMSWVGGVGEDVGG